MVDNYDGTVIGESIVVSGSLSGDEDLTVIGRVEGGVELTRTLIVETSGIVKADVTVRNAVISGILVGNVEASDSVEITESGRVVGDIKAPRVIIVEGARFRGSVDMGDLEAPRPSGPLPVRKERSASSSSSLTRSGGGGSSLPARKPPPPPPSASAPEKEEPKAKAPAKKSASKKPGKKKLKKKVVVKKRR